MQKLLFLKQMNKCLSLKAFLRLHYLCQLKLCFWKRSSGTSSRVTKKSKWKPWLRRGERQPLVCSWPLHHPTDQILGHRKNPPVFIKSNWEASFVLRFLRAEGAATWQRCRILPDNGTAPVRREELYPQLHSKQSHVTHSDANHRFSAII